MLSCLYSAEFPSPYEIVDPTQEIVPSTFREGSPTSMNLIKKSPGRYYLAPYNIDNSYETLMLSNSRLCQADKSYQPDYF